MDCSGVSLRRKAKEGANTFHSLTIDCYDFSSIVSHRDLMGRLISHENHREPQNRLLFSFVVIITFCCYAPYSQDLFCIIKHFTVKKGNDEEWGAVFL